MKVSKIRVRNFRSIKDETLSFPEEGLVALIGANNAGKSNFLRAIDLILGDFWSTEGRLEDYDFYGGNRTNAICIEIFFKDSQFEKFIFSKDESSGEYKLRFKYPSGPNLYYLSNEKKNQYPCTYLSAERSIARDISFTKWSLMGKVSKEFNKLMKRQAGVEEELKTKFNEVQGIFDRVESFKTFKEKFAEYFDDMQSDSPFKLKIDFKPFTPNNYFKTINILAEDPNFPGGNLDLEELGDGAKNLVILSLLRSYATIFRSDASGILAIEEPEIYLHPQARRHLYRILREIAEESNIQIIYTTHDPAFLRISQFNSIRRIYKINDEENTGRNHTKVKEVTPEKLIEFADKTGFPSEENAPEKVKEFYSVTSNHRLTEGYFSRMIILCEGLTEELTIPVYLKTAGIECDKLGISVLGVTGKGEIPKYWRLFHLFKIPIIIVFDNDSSSDGNKKNNKTLSDCFNIPSSDIENTVDTYKYVTFQKEDCFQQDAIILEKDFETSLSKSAESVGIDIGSLKTAAKELSPSKPVQANWIALKLQKQNPTFIPPFINEIVIQTKNILDITCNEEATDENVQNEQSTEDQQVDANPDINYESDIKPEDLPF